MLVVRIISRTPAEFFTICVNGSLLALRNHRGHFQLLFQPTPLAGLLHATFIQVGPS
jgi:hypothetical protein